MVSRGVRTIRPLRRRRRRRLVTVWTSWIEGGRGISQREEREEKREKYKVNLEILSFFFLEMFFESEGSYAFRIFQDHKSSQL